MKARTLDQNYTPRNVVQLKKKKFQLFQHLRICYVHCPCLMLREMISTVPRGIVSKDVEK